MPEKSKRTRGKSRPIEQRFAADFDKYINDRLKAAMSGEKHLSAQEMNAIRGRLKDLERAGIDTLGPRRRTAGTPVGDLLENAARSARGLASHTQEDAEADRVDAAADRLPRFPIRAAEGARAG